MTTEQEHVAQTALCRAVFTHVQQRGAPGHCRCAQVFGPDGVAVLTVEPTDDPASASRIAEICAAALSSNTAALGGDESMGKAVGAICEAHNAAMRAASPAVRDVLAGRNIYTGNASRIVMYGILKAVAPNDFNRLLGDIPALRREYVGIGAAAMAEIERLDRAAAVKEKAA